MLSPDTIKSTIARGKKAVLRRAAMLWWRVYRVQYRLGMWRHQYGGRAFSVVLLSSIPAGVYLSPTLQSMLENHFATTQAVEGLRGLILNTGTALVGATAVVTSLVLFAMQVNIERMPYGLFHRLSADRKLLSAFAIAFLLAIGVATLSTFADQSRIVIIVPASLWAIVFILILFVYAYRRALNLINPLQQLEVLVDRVRREFRIWAQRAKHIMPILEREDNASATLLSSGSTHDLARTKFFQNNKRWTDGAKQAIRYSMSLAQRYAEQRDYEVSGVALSTVVVINKEYINAKGKTFYANNPFVEEPLPSDDIIDDTLEHLRKNVQSAIARKDEQQIEQVLQAIAALVSAYLKIDYSTPHAQKDHARLAAGYLANAVEDVPHNMVDVLMEGQRLMGRSAQHLLNCGHLEGVIALSEKIAVIACIGRVKEDYRPVTKEGMTQLADITFALIRSKNHDIGLAVEKVRKGVALVVKQFLKVPDAPLSSIHSASLRPYYSLESLDSLHTRLERLANALTKEDPKNTDAQVIIWNIEQWANDLYRTEGELLLEAIHARSGFTFDMIRWIAGVTKILLAVSNAPACDQHTQNELRNHAYRLVATLTWIPDDKETVAFIERFEMTEVLFQAAIDAHNRGCGEIAKAIAKILLSRTFKGGRYRCDVLERGLCGVAVFAQMADEGQAADLMTAIEVHLSGESAPEQETRDDVARAIRKRMASLHKRGHWLPSAIEIEITRSDHKKLRPLLEKIAQMLSPAI